MRPNGALTALARQALVGISTFAAALILVGPSLAGDRAGIDFIGYSPDGGLFAFEEFGVQDGSGFAFANIFVIDLATDQWVAGTPVRVAAENEEVALSAIRSQAAAGAEAVLQDLSITEPVTIAALIGDGVPDNSGKALVFGAPSYQAGQVAAQYSLELTQYEAKSTLTCADWFDAEPLGFALSLKGVGDSLELYRDKTVPVSRGCPLDYRLYGVVLPFGASTIEDGVAIVSVYPGGFEGPDRRFLAVPLAP